jgi:transcriptional regulator
VADQVPTWNYVAVECEGPVRRLDHDELIELLTDLSTRNEARIEGVPWTMDKVSDKAMAGLTGAIVGFEMTVAEQRATFKLSQNKPADQHERVIAGLQASGQHAIAAMMRA